MHLRCICVLISDFVGVLNTTLRLQSAYSEIPPSNAYHVDEVGR